MQYQIQKYRTSDYSSREVLDRRDGLTSEADLQLWLNTVIANQVDLDPEFSIVPVPENHDWFMRDEVETPVETSVKSSMEGAPVDFQIVAAYELEQSRLRREASR